MELRRGGGAARDARGGARYLAKHPATSSQKVGVIGFCLGGYLALLSAAEAPDVVSAVVDCYGVGHAPPPASKLKGAKVLGIFGGKDHSAQEFAALEKSLREAGGSLEKQMYPEAAHAFLNEQRKDVYRPADAQDAWSRIPAFLKAKGPQRRG